ncbi:CcdC family protein [Aureibacillus halotolerans]|uniref:Membrane protein CcdC involved in cytochrome C biogenesis n=1 Tax=Aureibacillus halotolerans TaxID=1508390 RepID=A0A4R6U5I7_9BACI|nr:cytochrome c biogenesis protein CcdC [Aureibacillus halotolerans]TDQ39745.1 membrane protein CcdC involved in cytochrome C biogenesis [Aureibacillus halotolerans]
MEVVIATIVAVCMALIAIMIRLKAAAKPASLKKILLPPLFMSTGFLMFTQPMFHISLSNALEAFIVGALFSIVLIKTSRFEVRDEKIYLKRSRAFPFILLGLLVFRIILKLVLGQYIEWEALSGMFFILAFGMLLPWRLSMFIKFKRVEKTVIPPPTPVS